MSAKPHFLTDLVSEDIDHGGKWRLVQPLIWYSARLGRHIVMQRGFEADSYSVPAAFAFLVFKIDRRPAFLHDHLYAGKEGVTREQADLELLDAMKACGIGWLRRHVIYDGPAIFGGLFFKGRTKAPAVDPDSPLDQPPGA